ncbi:MAG: hypothetical protein K5679_08975 [Lachnospiraceae bacterium]|nr:hypothetical protein [Lachnospiraceae bacterium]
MSNKRMIYMRQRVRRLLTRCHYAVNRLYDAFTASKVDCSVGDILLKRGEIYHNQFLVASKVLDAERYMRTKEQHFPYQAAITKVIYGDSYYGTEQLNQAFADLIKSYLASGYKEDSYFETDKEFRLANGNHRCALNYLMDTRVTRVLFSRRRIRFDKGIDWYVSHKLDAGLLNKILDKYGEIQEQLVARGDCFCLLTNSEELADLLSTMTIMLSRKSVEIHEASNILGKDISPGKYILSMYSHWQPEYGVKKGKLVSIRNREIEQALISRASVYKSDKSVVITGDNCLEGRLIYESVIG